MKNKMNTPEQLQISLLKDLIEIESAFSEIIDMSSEINLIFTEYEETSRQMLQLESFMNNLKTTKLQPSIISHIVGIEGLDQLIGIDLSKVTPDNRNQMTNVAIENIGDNIGKVSDWLISRIKKVIEESKKFVIRMFKIWERILYSIEKIETFLANDIKELSFDETVFSTKKIRCYSYADMKPLIDNVNGLIHMCLKMFPVAEKGIFSFQTNFFFGMGIEALEVNTINSQKYFKVVKNSKNKIKRQVAQVHEHGWSSKLVFGYIKTIKDMVLNIRKCLEEENKALKKSIKGAYFVNGGWVIVRSVNDNLTSLFVLSQAVCKIGKELTTDYIKLFNAIKFHKKDI